MGYFWYAKNTQSLHHHQSASAIRIVLLKQNKISSPGKKTTIIGRSYTRRSKTEAQKFGISFKEI